MGIYDYSVPEVGRRVLSCREQRKGHADREHGNRMRLYTAV